MKLLDFLTYFSASFIGCVVCLIYFNPKLHFFDVMVDRHGRWRIPTNGGVTQTVNKFINAFPRFDSQFNVVDPQFDMDNEYYNESTITYILLFGFIGVAFMVIICIFLLARYCCNCCGGKNVRRKGYKESSINFYRYAIIILSFVLEALLIYGYFANTDLHNSLSVLTDSFVNTSKQLMQQFDVVKLPDSIPGLENVNMSLLEEDLSFSVRYASGQADIMKNFLDTFEAYRMGIIIANLIAATLGCSLGIAAGSVRKGTPVLIMVILFAVADCLFFFSFGIHFSGSKIIYDFCTDVDPYLDPGNDEFLPLRLQFFVPCVSSPIFPFINDYFNYYGLDATQKFIDHAKSNNYTEIVEKYVQWFNISDSSVSEAVNTKKDDSSLASLYETALNKTSIMTIIDQSMTCRWSKNELRLDSFLLCTYAKDNIDMIMMTQGLGCIVLIVLTLLGIPAIKRFKYAGNANLEGVLDANKRFMGKKAKAKRSV